MIEEVKDTKDDPIQTKENTDRNLEQVDIVL